MKRAKRFLAMLLAMVMMCGVNVQAAHPFPEEIYPDKYAVSIGDRGKIYNTQVYGTVETGIYGTLYAKLSYPITARCFDAISYNEDYNYFNYYHWYDKMYSVFTEERQLRYLSKLWLDYYRVVDPEVWPEEYLDYFDGFLKNLQDTPSYLYPQTPQYRVVDHEWNGRAITVTCEADYNITYNYYVYDAAMLEYVDVVEVNNDFSAKACFAVTDKLSGELVYLVRHSSLVLEPDYVCRPGSYYNDTLPCHPSKLEGEHKGTVTKTMKATLPEFFDPAKYDVEVYFYTYYDCSPNYEYTYYEDMTLHNAYDISPIKTIQGDANCDGVVNAADVTALSRYLSGTEAEISAGADYNGDSLVSASDLLVLRRKISGADV